MKKQILKQVEFVKSTGAFDERFYLSQFNENNRPESDLIEHYFVSGCSEGKNPNIWFSTDFYLNEYTDVKSEKINPFFHYLSTVSLEKRQPNESISPTMLNALYTIEGIANKIDVLIQHHQIVNGQYIDRDSDSFLEVSTLDFINAANIKLQDEDFFISPYFNTRWYAKFYGVPTEHAWPHFLYLGEYLLLAPCKQLVDVLDRIKISFKQSWFESFIRLPHRFDFLDYNALDDTQKCYEVYISGLFDDVWYTNEYESITDISSALHHFSLSGIYDDYNPNAYFDSDWYRQTYGLKASQIPLVHYIRSWHTNIFNPSKSFDVQGYVSKNPKLANYTIEPLAHYLHSEKTKELFVSISSIAERQLLFSSSALFMKEWYEAVNTDLQGANISSLEHYVLYGEKEGRFPNPFFNPTWYRQRYTIEVDESPLLHYLTTGYTTGYNPSPDFDSQEYISEYKLQNIETSPLEHYLTVGRNQGWYASGHSNQSYGKTKEIENIVEPEKLNEANFQIQLAEFGFRYSVDLNKDGVVAGWIYSESETIEPIIFELLIDGVFVKEIIADIERSDLSVLNIDSLNHGFYINANEWAHSPAYTFSVYEKKTQQALVLNQSVFTLIDKIEAFLGLQAYLRKQAYDKQDNLLAGEVLENLLPSVINSLRDKSLQLPNTNINLIDVPSHIREDVADIGYAVSIVIPVYKGIEETKNCILSALKAKNNTLFKLTVINDKSPEPEMYEMLRDLAHEHSFELLTNQNNLGFVKTVNLGMKSSSMDVILLNSDTVVQDRWLDAIYFEAYKAENSDSVGTVTPMSNNATICSFPRFCVDNELPETFDLNTLSRVCQSNETAAVDLPTAHGYCMFIKRDVLNKVGYFDEQKWGMGYAEENDFSLRAANIGWRHVMTNKTFVHHLGSVSFAEDSAGFIANNLQKLNGLYPDYPVRVRQFVKEDPVRFLRNELAEKLLIEESKTYTNDQNRSILFVSLTIGGGTQKAVEDLSEQLNEELQSTYMLTANNGVIWTLSSMVSNLESTYHIENESEYKQLVKMLQYLGVWHVHYHHVLEFSKKVWDIPSELKCDYDVTLHDFYMICPRVNMLTIDDQYCHEPPNKVCNTACLPELGVHSSSYLIMADFDNDVNHWQSFYQDKLNSARKVFTPSKDTKERILQKIPVENIVAQYHPETIERVSFIPNDCDTDLLHIGFIGAIGPHKGINKIKDLVIHIAENSLPIEIVILGYTSDDSFFENFNFVTITGAYKASELEELLVTYPVDVIFLSSIWPETFGYTYSEVIRHGLPVISFDIGAIPERAQNNESVLILSMSLEMSDIIIRITAFVENSKSNHFEVGCEYQSIIKDYYGLDI